MEGVTVLNEMPVVIDTSAGFSWMAIVCFAIGILIFILAVYSASEESFWPVLSVILIAVGVIITLNANKTYGTKYSVVIDEKVSLTEFLDKYEIIDQQGDIYNIIERENSENK